MMEVGGSFGRDPPCHASTSRVNCCRTNPAGAMSPMIRKRSSGTLSEWLARGEASSNPELRRFAEGVRRDEAAVHAAVTGTWSNGPVEGHVNRGRE